MGNTIETVIQEQHTDEVVLKISEDNKEEFTIENLKKADVAIEFTQPEAAVENIFKCFEAGIPVVVGTTAWLHRLEEVKQRCSEMNGSLFYSPNYSIGVNLFWEVNRRLAELMNTQPQYRVSMEEIHHTEKKDAPSGTAVKTAEIVIAEVERINQWELGADAKAETLPADSLLIVAKRLPGVPGTHTLTYNSSVDLIEIKHEAKSRRGFAEGAVMAARWMVGKKGVFEMKDMLAI